MCEIATYCYAASTDQQKDPSAAIRVHGFYRNESEARDHAQRMAREGTEVDEFVIQHVNTWFLVTPPVAGTGEEEEEIAAPENDDRSAGRMGSVCDIRKPSSTASTASSAPSAAAAAASTSSSDRTDQSGKNCLKNQRKTLEDLLEITEVAPPTDLDTYATCRERLALLRAFERKLRRLLEESQQKCQKAREAALDLSNRKPEYLSQYLDRYQQVLAESGLKPEKVGIMQFLKQDLATMNCPDPSLTTTTTCDV